MNLLKPTVLALACSCIALTGCGNEQATETSTNDSTSRATDEQIVLRGRIGGRDNPITAGSPAFVMMDVSIPSCADKEDDHCSIPWDYCCETRETIAANIATVIVVDEDGNQVDSDLAFAGLEPLDEVVVVGTVDARPNASVLTIRATGIHKKQG